METALALLWLYFVMYFSFALIFGECNRKTKKEG